MSAGWIRIRCEGASEATGWKELCTMTSIQVQLPKALSLEHAKAYALAHITQELERYGLDEALRGIGIKPVDASK